SSPVDPRARQTHGASVPWERGSELLGPRISCGPRAGSDFLDHGLLALASLEILWIGSPAHFFLQPLVLGVEAANLVRAEAQFLPLLREEAFIAENVHGIAGDRFEDANVVLAGLLEELPAVVPHEGIGDVLPEIARRRGALRLGGFVELQHRGLV